MKFTDIFCKSFKNVKRACKKLKYEKLFILWVKVSLTHDV